MLILTLCTVVILSFGWSFESQDVKCKMETTLSEDALFGTICVALTDSYSSQINISCPDSTIIGLTNVIIGIREGCTGNNKNISCCLYQVADTLIDGRCLRQNLFKNAGLYDKIVNAYLQIFSGKKEGIFRYSANVPIPTNLGYSPDAKRSSYIIFKYQCKPAKNFVTFNHTSINGTGTQALDITSSGILKIQDSVYLGTNHTLTDDDNSSMLNQYKCLIHSAGETVDIKIDALDIRFGIFDSSECNTSSLKFVDILNNVDILQQKCNSWFSPFNIKIAETLGVLVILTIPRQILEGTSIWLEINSNAEKKLEVRCGNIEDKLAELLRTQMNSQHIVIISIGAIAFTILVIFLIWGVFICYVKFKRASARRTEDEQRKSFHEYDYATVQQSMHLNTQEDVKENERVVYDKTTVTIHASNYNTLSDKKGTSHMDNYEVEDNYDHFTSVKPLNIATESHYDHTTQ